MRGDEIDPTIMKRKTSESTMLGFRRFMFVWVWRKEVSNPAFLNEYVLGFVKNYWEQISLELRQMILQLVKNF